MNATGSPSSSAIAHQILEDDRLQLLAGIGDLRLGQRDIAPIVRPGIVEQVEDDRAPLRRTCDLSTLRMRIRGLRSPASISRSICGIVPVGDVELVGQEVLGLFIARASIQPRYSGDGDPSSPSAALVEPLDLQPRLVPDREADRAERAGHALLRAANPPPSRSVAPRTLRRAPRTCPIGRCPRPCARSTSSSTCALIRPTTCPSRSASKSCARRMLEPGVLLRDRCSPWTSSFSGGTQSGSSL